MSRKEIDIIKYLPLVSVGAITWDPFTVLGICFVKSIVLRSLENTLGKPQTRNYSPYILEYSKADIIIDIKILKHILYTYWYIFFK